MNVLTWIVVVVLLIAFALFIGARCIEYTIEYWVGQIRHAPVDVPRTPCYVAAIFVGWNIAVPCAVITWITSAVWERPV